MTTEHCRLEHAVMPPPPLERVLRDRPLGDNTFLRMPTIVLICRRCWQVVLQSREMDGDTWVIHQLVVNPSEKPCQAVSEGEVEANEMQHQGGI